MIVTWPLGKAPPLAGVGVITEVIVNVPLFSEEGDTVTALAVGALVMLNGMAGAELELKLLSPA